MRKTSYNGTKQELTPMSMNVASNFKFQNVQRLNTMVGQITQRQKQLPIRSIRSGMSDKVLDLIKNRIKTNYDKLYQNYDDNKKQILKQIQHVEMGMTGQNQNKGFDHFIKEKANYDRIRIQCANKEKKFNKLIQLRDQLKEQLNQNGQFQNIIYQKSSLINQLDTYRQSLDYQTAILDNMKQQKRLIKLFLKDKYQVTLKQQQNRKQRTKKLQNTNHNKKSMLQRIEQNLKKQQRCQIPQNLAQCLQTKLAQYQAKHIYSNILSHQTHLSQVQGLRLAKQQLLQKQSKLKLKQQKQNQQRKQYQLTYNFYLIKQLQEEKIRKICGVDNLGQIVNNSMGNDQKSLQSIQEEIRTNIDHVKQQNQIIKTQIQIILTAKQNNTTYDLLHVQQQYIQAEKQLRALQNLAQKKYANINNWQSAIQLMNQKDVTQQNLGEAFKKILQSIARDFISVKKSSLEDIDKNTYSIVQTKFKKIKEQFQSECSIISNI